MMAAALSHLAEVLAFAIAVLFLVSGLGKLRDMGKTRENIANYALLPSGIVPAFAAALVTAELTSAVLITVPMLREVGLILAGLLFAFFFAAIGINLVRGRRDMSCGCTIGDSSKLSGRHLVRLAALIGATVFAESRTSIAPGFLSTFSAVAGGVAVVLILFILEATAAGRSTLQKVRTR